MKVGDENNYYFFFLMKVRFLVNYIFFLVNDEGIRFLKNSDIRGEILNFYYKLIGFNVF